jgi:hypothetical protein
MGKGLFRMKAGMINIRLKMAKVKQVLREAREFNILMNSWMQDS